MKRYQQMVIFHAENDEDATQQVNKSLGAFDDGYERVALREVSPMGRAPDRLVFIEGEKLAGGKRLRITPEA